MFSSLSWAFKSEFISSSSRACRQTHKSSVYTRHIYCATKLSFHPRKRNHVHTLHLRTPSAYSTAAGLTFCSSNTFYILSLIMLLVVTVSHEESDSYLKISEAITISKPYSLHSVTCNKTNTGFTDVRPGLLTWEIPDSNSSGFSPLGFTILALVLNMAFVSVKRNEDNMRVTDWHGSWMSSCTPS